MKNDQALSIVGPKSEALVSREMFAKGVKIIEAHFPSLPLTEEKLTIWGEMLADLTDEQFIQGIKSFCLAHKEIYPNTNVIAHIRDYALRDLSEKTAGEAWLEVLREIYRAGSYGTPSFSNPEIKRAVECVSWKDICQSETIGVERAHFMRTYDELIDRDKFNAVTRSDLSASKD